MRIRLINPLVPYSMLGGDFYFRLPTLGLLKVAALTPPEHTVDIVDEKVEALDLDEPVDLVGITAMTPAAYRAYALADHYRSKGVPVIMGGMHATKCPEEALEHCDAVVQGEAEGVWPQVLLDAAESRLKKTYRQDGFPSLDHLPIVNWDLYKGKKYLPVHFVETTRGCPYDCDFCSVTDSYGAKFRNRPIDQVERELGTLKPFEGRFILKNVVFFVDDIINSRADYSKDLFRRLIPYNLKWLGQATSLVTRDTEMLTLMRRSGCLGVLIGFETLSDTSLSSVGKNFNKPQNYLDIINRLHDHGIGINGSFVFGFDHDDESVFDRTLDFVVKAKLDSCYFSILTPYPGTDLHKKFTDEGRIFDLNWEHYNTNTVVFRPMKMSPEKLMEGYHGLLKGFYTYGSIFKRLWGSGTKTNFFGPMNFGFRQTIKRMTARGPYSLTEETKTLSAPA
ncbi:MAG: hypothetical protein A2V83_10270 [Nitrospirae bacterium RBG_16_64_22]|nr:MAG: hypothetical protein A2V83_10270 [Nitrospirae bacterium RBG_16_64_22]